MKLNIKNTLCVFTLRICSVEKKSVHKSNNKYEYTFLPKTVPRQHRRRIEYCSPQNIFAEIYLHGNHKDEHNSVRHEPSTDSLDPVFDSLTRILALYGL